MAIYKGEVIARFKVTFVRTGTVYILVILKDKRVPIIFKMRALSTRTKRQSTAVRLRLVFRYVYITFEKRNSGFSINALFSFTYVRTTIPQRRRKTKEKKKKKKREYSYQPIRRNSNSRNNSGILKETLPMKRNLSTIFVV